MHEFQQKMISLGAGSTSLLLLYVLCRADYGIQQFQLLLNESTQEIDFAAYRSGVYFCNPASKLLLAGLGFGIIYPKGKQPG